MYKTGELKFKENVSYTEMMTIAMQYTRNAVNAAFDEGAVAMDFARMTAVLYAFVEVPEETISADEMMHDVLSYGYDRYLEYIRDHTPMGAGYFYAFLGMLDRGDKAAEKRQPVDVLIDSLIRASDSIAAFVQPNGDGASAITEVLNAIRGMANNEGAMPPD